MPGARKGWALVAAVMLTACGRSQQDVVNDFVAATKNQDLATLARVSIVPLPYEIASWRITRTATLREELFDLEKLQRKLSQARAARDAALAENNEAERLRIQSRVERFRYELEEQREAARKSVRTWSPIDQLQGVVEVAELEVNLQSPQGDERAFSLTMKRYSLGNPQTGVRPSAEWIVTGIEPGT